MEGKDSLQSGTWFSHGRESGGKIRKEFEGGFTSTYDVSFL